MWCKIGLCNTPKPGPNEICILWYADFVRACIRCPVSSFVCLIYRFASAALFRVSSVGSADSIRHFAPLWGGRNRSPNQLRHVWCVHRAVGAGKRYRQDTPYRRRTTHEAAGFDRCIWRACFVRRGPGGWRSRKRLKPRPEYGSHCLIKAAVERMWHK